MPLVRRKKVVLHDVPEFVASEPATAASARDVFYIAQTGEIFPDYEAFSTRMSFYNMKIFQCELTGKSGLDYWQALESERSEAQTLHSRFPAELKAPILAAVQWQIMGRLDHLVDMVYDRFVNRYYAGEKVFVDVDGEKYFGRITKVFPPKNLTNGTSQPSNTPLDPHVIGVDLRIPAEDALARDDPMAYFYAVQLVEDSTALSVDSKPPGTNTSESEKWSSSEMETKASSLSRDRLSFSKSILRRFIRDCVERDAAVASPWTVKRIIAEQHGVATEMPDDIRRAIDGAKAGEKEKRKKVWEDKFEAEGIPSKRRKKEEPVADSEANTPAPAASDVKPKPKGPIKYPIEDLDVTITDREKKAGRKVMRPPISREVPFGEAFERFLMSWAFFQSFGAVLKISTFTLDEFESAIRHTNPDIPCTLLAETHSCLLTVAKERTGVRYTAIESLEAEEMDLDDSAHGVSLADIAHEAKGLGYKSQLATGSSSKDSTRSTWEDTLAIYLRDHATPQAVPNLRRIMQGLMFEPSLSSSTSKRKFAPSTPAERYPYLLSEDKIAIFSFLCEICIASRVVRAHIDWGDASLTELRKEKIEVNREKRRLTDEIAQIDAKIDPEGEGSKVDAGQNKETVSEKPASTVDMSSPAPGPLSEEDELESKQNGNLSDATDDVPASGRRKRPSVLRRVSSKLSIDSPNNKVASHTKDRAQARIKAAELKSAIAERRKLDEELNKVERRLEAIEREFRQLFGVGRTRHMGRDRFFNRYWWLDGMGIGQLITSNGSASYGTGRIFVQGPSVFDLEVISARGEGVVEARQREEDGPDGSLAPGAWGMYSEPQEIEELLTWFNGKGIRENQLKNFITKWLDHLMAGVKRRQALCAAALESSASAAQISEPEAASRPERRSTRGKGTSTSVYDSSREPYLAWTNRHQQQNGR
ncbi:hypothetical protein DL93DRAFT_2083951 [Clavulina sp. PMI_390]|nr:hypothetical protein DL93DRAFT_2083951 [Clavulina sp. PMI_390]